MNRAMILTTAALAALSVAACNKRTNTATGNTATVAATTTNTANPGQTGPVNTAQDAMSAAVGATSAATLASHDTGAFVENAGEGGMYEIQAAKIAEKKAASPDVKAFAKMMVIDHTAMANEMKPAIKAAGKAAPTSLDQRRQGLLDNLAAAPAGGFDKAYIDQQVAAHDETLTMLKGYADNGDDAGLKAMAAKAVPKVQSHLDKAKALQTQLVAAK